MEQNNLIIRKPTPEDDLEKIAELLYNTDPYIYPYWFESVEKCRKELAPLLLEDKFFFSLKNLYISIEPTDNEIVGVVCILDKNCDLSYDYSELKKKNERYAFTIENYIEGLIKEVKEADFAYISNVCVDANYRGRHIGKTMLDYVIDIYKKKLYDHIVLDVLAENPGAIKLYQNLGFEQFTEIFKGFNDPKKKRPDVFSMESKIKNR
ncbi:MAG: GNAT family N-acetyltransferase [Bacilli bacterium]|nr:GNAT family N-acetyltransferase [Bacilli bacterium]